jgi:hypothetical protein
MHETMAMMIFEDMAIICFVLVCFEEWGKSTRPRVLVCFSWQGMCLYMASKNDFLNNGRNSACDLQIRSALMII